MDPREERSAAAWRLAQERHWVLARRDLLALGYSADAIKHRIASGRLHPVLRGVYAVGRPGLTREGRWMAALLACGESAVLSHRSAAALWGFARERPRWARSTGADSSPNPRQPIEVSLTRRREPRLSGIRARTRPSLSPAELTTHRGVPTTTPARTLLDLATLEPPNRVERAVNEADKLDVIDPDALRLALDHLAGTPGIRRLRAVLDRHTFRLSDDELELLFRPLAARAGIPVERTKATVNGFEVDFLWPALGLVVETDGWRYHRTPAAQSRDALRFQLHTAAGLTALRFSHQQIKRESDHVVAILRSTAARLRTPGNPPRDDR